MESEQAVNFPDGAVLLRFINNTASCIERTQVEKWIAANNENELVIIQFAKIHHAQYTKKRIEHRNPYQAFDKVTQRINRNRRRIIIRRIAVTVSLIIGVSGIMSMVQQYLHHKESASHMITVQSNAGMRSYVELPDGTMAYLNANSTLVYPVRYAKNERKVQLSGEAYFRVAHDPQKPFIVSSSNDMVHIRALGTEFNIQAYPYDSLIQTSLINGSIQVGIKGSTTKIVVNPLEKIIFNMLSGKVYVQKINAANEIAWMNGSLVFKDTSIPEVLRKLTHFYSVEFDVADRFIYDYTFTGSFKNRPLFQILDYMMLSSKISYTVTYPENKAELRPVINLKSIK